MTIGVTLSRFSALFNDSNGDGYVSPGDTLLTHLVINNPTNAAINSLVLNDNGTVNTSIVLGSIVVTTGDTYNGITGNTPFTGNVLANDYHYDGANANSNTGLLVGAVNGNAISGTTTVSIGAAGSVTIGTDGAFTFTPATGFTGLGSFTYSTSDGSHLLGTVTVNLNVSGLVWYVDSTANGTGADGSYLHPFTSLTPLNGANGAGDADGANDTIFVYDRGTAYSGNFTLEAGEKLYGSSHQMVVNGLTIGGAGNHATIDYSTTGLLLNSGNTIDGFDLFGSSTSAVGIKDNGSSTGTLTIANTNIGISAAAAHNGATGSGETVQILHGGAVTATFGNLSTLGSTTNGFQISGDNTNALSGTLTVTTGTIAGAATYGVAIGDGSPGHAGSLAVSWGGTIQHNGEGVGSTGAEVFLDGTSAGSQAITFSGNITHNGQGNAGIAMNHIAGGTIAFTNTVDVTNTSSTGNGVQISAQSGGSVAFNDLQATSKDGSALSIGGMSGGTFAVDGSNAPAFLTTNGTAAGATGKALSLLNNTAGTIAFTGGGLTLSTSGTGTGLYASSNLASTTIEGSLNGIAGTGTGKLVDINGMKVGTNGITFDTVATGVSAVAGTAVSIASLSGTGTFDVGQTTIEGATGGGIALSGNSVAINLSSDAGLASYIKNVAGTSFSESGGSANITFNGDITKSSTGTAIFIDNHDTGIVALGGNLTSSGNAAGIVVQNSAGTVNFSGAKLSITTTTSAGVTLSTNTGGTINFTPASTTGNGLLISTGSGTGFDASGGGTVSVTGSLNTINATSGTALSIKNTTIGASNVTFKSISSGAGANNGIVLDTTGASGGLHVTGTGSANTGGTINGKTGADGDNTAGIGIYLNSTKDVQLNWMNLHDFQNFGIRGTSVNGFQLNNSTVNATASSTATNGTQQGNPNNEGSIVFNNLTGTATLTNDTVASGLTTDLSITNTSGTLNLTVTGSHFTGRNTGVITTETVQEILLVGGVNLGDAPTMNATFTGNTIDNHDARGLQAVANDGTIMDIEVGTLAGGGNTFTGMPAAMVDLAHNGTGNYNFNVRNNTFTVDVGTGATVPINIFNGSASGSASLFQGRVTGNTITARGNQGFDGISMTGSGPGTMTVLVDSNILSGVGANGISYTGAQNSATNTANLTITNNTVGMGGTAPATGIEVSAVAASTATATVNATITGNNVTYGGITPAPTPGSYRVDARFAGSTLNIQGYAGASQDTTAMKAYIAGLNKVNGATAQSTDVSASTGLAPGGHFGNVASVSQPSNSAPLMVTPPDPTDTTIVGDKPVSDPVVTTSAEQTGAAGSTPATSPAPTTTAPPPAPTPVSEVTMNLTQAQLDTMVAAAIDRWAAAGATPDEIAAMKAVVVSVSDIYGLQVGDSNPGHILVSANGAGYGWFVDATPGDDNEFTGTGTDLTAKADGQAAGHVDLLTVIEHELGHQIGLGDSYMLKDAADLMYGYVNPGERRLPSADDVHAATGTPVGHEAFALSSVNIATLPATTNVDVTYLSTVGSFAAGPAPTLSGSSTLTYTGSGGTLSASESINGTNDTLTNSNGTITTQALQVATLTLGNLVFNDANKDGLFNAADGDTGINGVTVKLYIDANANGVYDALSDTFVTSTVTAGGGLYSFSGLAPGNYIVVVPAANFASGQPLYTLRPHAGALDPDNNTDNDNNGIAVAGGDVASQAITLSYDNEGPNFSPTGVAGNDTNNTLDFGFQANSTPVANADSLAATDEDTAKTYAASDFTGNDTDADGDTLTITSVTNGSHGTAVLNGNGTVTYTPAANYNGSDTFTYTISDGHGGTATANATLTINAINDAPTATIGGVPIGAETRVNTTTASDQSSPSVAVLSGGGYVVTWQSNNQDGSGNGIYSQRYDASGVAQGAETLVNTTTASDQATPSVAALSGGGYVVIWHSMNQDAANTWGVYSQRYDASGVKQGAETLVNTTTASDQYFPSVAALSGGGYVVTWHSQNQDGSGAGVYSQRYDASGVKQGAETLVNTTTANEQSASSVTALSNGGYVVTWQSFGQDGSGYGVYSQRYDASGVKQGAETLVNTTTAGEQSGPSVAALSGGGYVVTWQSFGQDGSGYGVYSQRYDASGVAQGTETRVNTTTAGDQLNPSVAALSGGGYVVTWQSNLQDGSGYGVYSQRYDASGVAQGAETRVNTTTANEQSTPSVGALSGGGYVVTWQSNLQDGSGLGVYSQRYGNAFVATEQVATNLKGTLSVADVDGGAGSETVTLSVDYGVLHVAAGTSGAVVTNNDSAAVTITGTIAQINALLSTDASSAITYTANTDTPPASATLTLHIDDGGNSGAGGALTGDAVAAIAITPVNDAPSGANNSDTTLDNVPLVLTTADFATNFTDPDGNAFNGVTITTLPSTGVIKLSGVAVTAGDFITKAHLDAGDLTYTPPGVGSGGTSPTFTFQVHDNGGTAQGGVDTDPTPNTFTIVITPSDLPPVLDLNGAASGIDNSAAYSEQASPTVLASGLTLTDSDSANLTGATVTIGTGFQAGADHLTIGGNASGTVGTISFSYNAATGVMALTGTGTVAAYQALLNQVAFDSSSDAPGTSRDISWTANDGTLPSTTAHTTLAVTPVNDAPTGTDSTITATEDAPRVLHGTDFGFHDVDGDGLGSVTISSVSGGTIYFDADGPGGNPPAAVGSLPMTFSAADLAAGNVTFVPSSNLNGTGVGSIVFKVSDNSGAANATAASSNTLTVDVTAVNDAPVASGSASAPTIAEDTPASGDTVANIFGASFSDTADNQTAHTGGSSANSLAGVAVTANNATTEGTWQYFNGASWVNISTSLSNSSALLLGASTPVRFNPAQDYNGSAPTLVVHLIDSSGGSVTTGSTVDLSGPSATGGTTAYSSGTVALGETITPVDDNPVLDLDTTSGGFGANNGLFEQDPTPTNIAPNAQVTDVDNANFNGGTLTVSITANGQSGDHVKLAGYTDGTHTISVSGGHVFFDSVDIGTYTDGDATTPLSVTLNVSATPLATSYLVKSVSVTFDADDPSAAVRTLHYVITDGSGGSASADATYNVTAANDAPALTAPTNASVSFTENNAAVAILQGVVLSDPDNPANFSTGSVDINITGTPGGINLKAGSNFTIHDNGNSTFTLMGPGSVAIGDITGFGTTHLQVTNLTSAATLATLNDLIDDWTFSIAGDDVADASGTITLTFNDGHHTGYFGDAALTATQTQSLAVTGLNDPPVNNVPGTQTLTEDGSKTFNSANSNLISISDADDDGGSLTVTLSVAHGTISLSGTGGLSFSTGDGTADASMTFSGTKAAINAALNGLSYTPTGNFNGNDTLSITTNDNGHSGDGPAGQDVDTVTLHVTAVNDAPTVTNPNATAPAINEDSPSATGNSVASLFGGNYSDATDNQTANGGSSADALAGVAVTANGSNNVAGHWQYSTDGGAHWTDIPTTASNSAAFLLSASTAIRFNPVQDYNGAAPTLTVHLIDASAGSVTTGNNVDISALGATGGTTAYSTGTVTLAETVNAVNDPPVLDLNGAGSGTSTSINYTEGQSYQKLAPSGTVTDVDSANYPGGVLTIAFTANGTTADQLAVLDQGSGVGKIQVDEVAIYYDFGHLDGNGDPVGPEQIATYYGGTGGDPLVITFNALVTPAIAQKVLEDIGYENTSNAPSELTRTVTFTLAESDGATSTPVTATINVTGIDNPATLGNDFAHTDEAHSIIIAVTTNDTDSDGPPPMVTKINGQAVSAGQTVVLASGALATLNADGTITYDPYHKFDTLTSPAGGETGASNTQGVDTFTYTTQDGSTATVTLSIDGVAGPGDWLRGSEVNDTITGTPGNDVFMLQDGGNDTAIGFGGSDIFFYGAALTAADSNDGGAGFDGLALQGDYWGAHKLTLGAHALDNIESMSMQSGSITRWGESGANRYSYDITTVDANVAAGQQLIVNGQSLLAGENFTFNGSAETNGSFLIYGGRGTDTLTGGAGNDIFYFEGDRWNSTDHVDGGGGFNAVGISGANGMNDIVVGVGQLVNIQALSVSNRYASNPSLLPSYHLTLLDGNGTPGGRLIVNAGSLTNPTQTFTLDAHTVTGNLDIYGAATGDTIVSGSGNDLIYGGLGADTLTGGAGGDVFQYRSIADSTVSASDHILDFMSGTDKIDLSLIDANPATAADDAFTLSNDGTFHGINGELREFYDAAHGWWVIDGDVNGDGQADFTIHVTTQGNAPLVATDFIL
jgi:hypothetical protein